jgi:hypothetical protein
VTANRECRRRLQLLARIAVRLFRGAREFWYRLGRRKVPMAETETKSICDPPIDEAVEARLDAEADAEIEAG